ncbi:MAG: hypothetical protein MI756_05815, partial [Chromatiales bacterium]|nr:hypothetical protein [Chromatiales bacterium]
VILHERMITPLGAKNRPSPLFMYQYGGLRLKKRHEPLLVAHLEQPNYTPRALIGAFSGTTGRIGLVLTGPSTFFRCKIAISALGTVIADPIGAVGLFIRDNTNRLD